MSESLYDDFLLGLSHFMQGLSQCGNIDDTESSLGDLEILTLPINVLDDKISLKISSPSVSQGATSTSDRKPQKKKSLGRSKPEVCNGSLTWSEKHKWSTKDDNFLIKVATMYYNDWKKIRNRICRVFKTTQSINFLKKRFKSLKSNTLEKKRHFTKEEDGKLIQAVESHGTNWSRITLLFSDRDQTMVKNRFYYLRRRNKLDIKSVVDENEPKDS